jgi:peroxiredoxin
MKIRTTILILALAVLAAMAGAAYWYAQRELVVERPSLGGPPPVVARHENLVGRRVPGFSAVDQNGQATGTDALHGRVAVVNIWATWCRPCVEEMPRFEREVWARFRPDVTVIAVAGGESAAKIRDFNTKAHVTFSLVEDPRQKIARRFGGDDAIPRTYVVDRSGVVVYQSLGYSDDNIRELVTAVDRAVAQR